MAARSGKRTRRSTARRRSVVLGAMGVVALSALLVVILLRPGGSSTEAWSRLETEDVHSLAFVDDDAERLLFGHHGGVLATEDGGVTWQSMAIRSDAMSLGVASSGSIVIAGHGVLAESRDGGQTWADVPADLPSLDIHGFTRDPGDPGRMWAYLATGGFWESRDSGRTWEQILAENVFVPQAIATPSGTDLFGVMGAGLARSEDGGRTWRTVTDPELYPLSSLAAAPDGSVLIAGGSDGLARSVDGGASWTRLPFDGEPAVVAVTDRGDTIAVVTRTGGFYRSDDGGATWPGPS